MKKKLCLFFLLVEVFAYSQDYTSLHSRYWYYRTRLRNDFMKVGLTKGCSIPMEERGDGYNPKSTIPAFDFSDPNSGEQGKWGDAMGELGYYIGILATEYNLLSRNNQETDSVRYELYCALQALNRMDYYAETYFTHAIANSPNPQTFGASFNGFMLRDDVPIDFVQNNLKHFNYFGDRGFCSKVKLKNISTTAGNSAQMQGQTYKAPEYYPNGLIKKPGRYEENYAGSYISQDNWINCIVGLALVRKFVPSGVNYKNMSFMDGNPSDISQEAFSIALRVMNYFKSDPTWNLRYPTLNLIGGNWGGIGTGLAFAHAEALNKMDQHKWGHFVQPDPLSFNTWCEYNDWRHDGNWLVQLYKNSVIIPLMFMNYNFSSHASGTLGNIFTANPSPYAGGEFTYKYTQLYQTFNTKPDVEVQIANLSSVCNCEYTFRGVDTKHQLQHHINHFKIWHPELIRVVLHGDGECFTTNLNMSYFNAAVSLLSSAPCYGPAKWDQNGDQNFPNGYQWDTQTRLDHPESVGGNGWAGEYNGIDYMLYHNLVTIIDIEKNGINDSKRMVDFGQRHITTSYPTSVGGQNWGATNLPATVKSFEYIVANNLINPNTNVTYLAGKEITLMNGFSAVNSNSFTAAIQIFNCSEILSNPLDPSANGRMANNSNSSNNQSGNSIYPDLLATSYEETNTSEATATSTNNSVTYNPILVHNDTLSRKTTVSLNVNIAAEIAPNPSNGLAKLFLSKPELVRTIDVIDPMGKLLFTIPTVSFSNDIDLGGISKGVYTIAIKGFENEVLIKKIVIQ